MQETDCFEYTTATGCPYAQKLEERIEALTKAIDKLAMPNDIEVPSRVDLDQRISYAMQIQTVVKSWK